MILLGTLIFLVPAATFVVYGIFLLSVGFASILSGYGLLRARAWVRLMGRLTAIGYLVAGFLLAISFTVLLTALGILTLILGVGTLVYLRLPRAKSYLGQ